MVAVFIEDQCAVDLFFYFVNLQANFEKFFFGIIRCQVYFLVNFTINLYIAIVNIFIANVRKW